MVILIKKGGMAKLLWVKVDFRKKFPETERDIYNDKKIDMPRRHSEKWKWSRSVVSDS